MEDEQTRITSGEHVFVFGDHNDGRFGGVVFVKGGLYMASFDLKLGAADANKTFNLYIAKEGDDPRFGTVVKTLTLNFADINNFVTENTDYSATLDYGLDRVWNFSAFNRLKENSAKRESEKARMVSTAADDPAMFVFGTHKWGRMEV